MKDFINYKIAFWCLAFLVFLREIIIQNDKVSSTRTSTQQTSRNNLKRINSVTTVNSTSSKEIQTVLDLSDAHQAMMRNTLISTCGSSKNLEQNMMQPNWTFPDILAIVVFNPPSHKTQLHGEVIPYIEVLYR